MSQQEIAEVRGWGYVSDLTPDKAEELVRLIPTLETDTMTWGKAEKGGLAVDPEGRVVVAMMYGVVRGAWPSDLVKKLRAAADKVQPGAHVQVAYTAHDYIDGEPDPEPVADPGPDPAPTDEWDADWPWNVDYRDMTAEQKAAWHEEREGDEAKARKARERQARSARWPKSAKARKPTSSESKPK